MIIYSHRGNFGGHAIENAANKLPLDRWSCEIDLWKIKDMLYLGHDGPEYLVMGNWLEYYSDKLLIHAKNADALSYLINSPKLLGFWHQTDDFTLTTDGKHAIIYPGKQLIPNAIVMKPELYHWDTLVESKPFGICTDYPELYS